MDRLVGLNVHLLMYCLPSELEEVYNLIVQSLALVHLKWILKVLMNTFIMQ